MSSVKLWVLLNENAGRSLPTAELQSVIERAGHAVSGVAKHYDERTRPPSGTDVIVAAGGDGTVATAAAIASKTSAALAILPLGTANNIATSLGITGTLHDVVAGWSTAARMPFDLGRARAGAREWLIVEGAGAGLVPAGIARAQAELNKRAETTPACEVEAAIGTFRDTLQTLQPERWTITVDGTQLSDDFLLVEVLNIPAVGPNLEFAPDATPGDGYLDVVLAREHDREELNVYLQRRVDGAASRPALPRHRARQVTLEGRGDLHIDDERIDARGLGPLSIVIQPAALTVLV
jgi:diacylglycerol kinase (ATP)